MTAFVVLIIDLLDLNIVVDFQFPGRLSASRSTIALRIRSWMSSISSIREVREEVVAAHVDPEGLDGHVEELSVIPSMMRFFVARAIAR